VPALVTANATILCSHGGRVTLIPGQAQTAAGGGALLCEPDLMGAPIVGCPVAPSPGTKPCTTVISTLPGSFSPKVTAGGRPVYLSTLTGMTDGVPPGMISVIEPGAPLVQA
jgi:hypothetical protein